MDLILLQKELYKLISPLCGDNLYQDYLPVKDTEDKELDYFRNIYTTYSLGNIYDNSFKNRIILEIQVVGDIENKSNIVNKALDIDRILKGTYIPSCLCKVTKPNVWYIPFNDLEDNRSVITLNYEIYNYNHK